MPDNVSTPVTLNVKATYGLYNDIIKVAVFSVPATTLSVSPTAVLPGQELTLNTGEFTRYDSNITVKIGNFDAAAPTGATADGAGQIKDLTVTVPTLDAGAYTVKLQVGDTVAIGSATVLGEIMFGDSPLPDALLPLGNNLVRVFHFNNATKAWSFYDPRPEFTDLNTLTELSPGQPYWILVRDNASVRLNLMTHNLT